MADSHVIRRQRKAGLTRQLGKLHRLIVEEDKDAVLDKLVQLRAAFTEFEGAHDTYHDTLDAEGDIDASELWFSDVERGYIVEVKAAKAWLQNLSAGDAHGKEEFDDVSTSSAADVSQSALINLLSIPKVELDKFNGDPLEYQSFMSIFNETVHNKTGDAQVKLTRQSETKRFKVFVANRVEFIRKNSGPEQWNYVTGESNPVDVVSRGCLVKDLPSSWKVGPEMLYSYKCTWPTMGPEVCVPEGDVEVRSCLAVVHPPPPVAMKPVSRHPVDQLMDYHSSFYKLKKAVAWLVRVRRRLQKVTTCVALEPLSVGEMSRAETLLIRHVQAEAFPTELRALCQGQVVGRSSSIRDLSPRMYDGVVVVSSRIKHAAVADNMKRPVILPAKHKLSQMILTEYHNGAHLGTEWTLCQVRGKYWIPRARNLLKKIKGRCVTCRKLYAAPMTQKMADLPPERGEPGKPPFTYVGMDLFGPFFVRIGRAEVKRYGCVYTCFTTRAVHLEVLISLEADSFINGFIRFMARRGCPKKVWSDNGTNIVGARGEMSRSLQNLQRSKVVEAARRRDVEWTFNPPYASHHGGVWERIIRIVRRVLVAVLGSSPRLTDEILHTMFCEIENIINGRPLTKSSDDVNDEAVLTPNHLLLMRNNAALPWGGLVGVTSTRSDGGRCSIWRLSSGKRWVKEYLPLLHTRQKWHDVETNLKVGELVLIVNENMP